MLHDLDLGLLQYLNSFAHKSVILDKAIVGFSLTNVHLLKGVPLVACLWWLWFSVPPVESFKRRRCVVASFAGAFLAVAVARVVQNMSPERPRPLHNPDLDIIKPFGVTDNVLADYSSFPSDTTALLLALVTGIWLASRPLGVVAFLWAMAFGAIPRIYAGFHYPSDILGGMVIGILSTLVVAWSPAGTLLSKVAFEIRRRHRGLFYAAAFILSYQVAMIFEEIRRIGTALFKVF